MGLSRRLANLACRTLQAMLPPPWDGWGWAVRQEVASIPDDGDALKYALGGLLGIGPRLVVVRLLYSLVALAGDGTISRGEKTLMAFPTDALIRPRALGILCATASVGLGLAFMATAGAPLTYLAVNAGALIIGIALIAIARPWTADRTQRPGILTLAFAALLLATALLGDQVEGASRWFKLGPLFLQTSLLVLPAMIVGFSRSRNALSTVAMAIAALALAIQPDRAMAGMLAAGLTAIIVMRRDRFALAAWASSMVGFAATLVQADNLPAVPYVDQIFYSAFDIHPFIGMAVLSGSALLIVPAIIGHYRDPNHGEHYLAFGTVWMACILAAGLGNYPTPVVGYGGSAILGYLLSLTMLPKLSQAGTVEDDKCREAASDERSGPMAKLSESGVYLAS